MRHAFGRYPNILCAPKLLGFSGASFLMILGKDIPLSNRPGGTGHSSTWKLRFSLDELSRPPPALAPTETLHPCTCTTPCQCVHVVDAENHGLPMFCNASASHHQRQSLATPAATSPRTPSAWPVDLLFGRLALDASTARPMWLPSSQRQDFQCEEHEVGVSTFSHSRQVLSCQDSQNKLPICQGVSCPDCRLQDSHSRILDRWTQRFCLKAISSKTECENLVSPPLDGLIRWESVERRTRKM